MNIISNTGGDGSFTRTDRWLTAFPSFYPVFSKEPSKNVLPAIEKSREWNLHIGMSSMKNWEIRRERKRGKDRKM